MQTKSWLTFNFPEFPNPIAIEMFYGNEQLNKGCDYHLTIHTDNSFKYLSSLIGNLLGFSIQSNNYIRHFSGYLVSISALQKNRFRLHLVSYMQLLQYTNNFRIFKNQSVRQTINDLLIQHKFPSYQSDTHLTHKQIPYITQYNESDWNFITRILQDNNIYYYLAHNEKNHYLRLLDKHNIKKQKDISLPNQNLARADYQCWKWLNKKNNSTCYSNYPYLTLPQKINKKYIITNIRHHAMNNSRIFYQCFLNLINIDSIETYKTHIIQPKITGIQTAIITSNNLNSLTPWNHKKNHSKPLPTIQPLSTSYAYISFKPNINHTVIIKYKDDNPNNPQIIGSLYGKENHAPFAIKQGNQIFGIKTPTNQSLKFTNKSLHINSKKFLINTNISDIKLNQNFSLTSENNTNLQSTNGTITVKSNSKITLNCGTSNITIEPNKITIQSKKIYLN